MYNANQDEDYDDDYGDLARVAGVSFVMNVDGGDKGFIALGASSKSSVWEYDPKTDLWIQRTYYVSNSKKSPREGAIAFSFLEKNQALVGLGLSGNVPHETFSDFHPRDEDNTYDDD